MAFTSTPSDFSPSSIKRLDPAKYTSLSDYINEVNKPDNRDSLVKTYGSQGITGFLQMVGAVTSAGTSDEVQYWEEARLHPRQTYAISGSAVTAAKIVTLTFGSGNAPVVRVNDVVLLNGDERGVVTAVTGTTSFTVANLADANFSTTELAVGTHIISIVGNLYGQGTDQPGEYLESNVIKRSNPYMIVKEIFKVTGSQATNLGWINLGGGDYRWYVKGEQDTRQRFMDKREMMMLLGQKNANTTNASADTFGGGSEGYFSAIEDRGMVHNGLIDSMAKLDLIVKEFDKQGAGSEYALYVNRDQDLAIDDLVAGLYSGGGLANAYGAFNNSADTAIELGFKSFGRGGYTFHKHDWKLLNDPTLWVNYS